MQETFLALLRDAGRLDGTRGTVLAWLFAVARNQIFKQMRARDRHLSLENEEPGWYSNELKTVVLTTRKDPRSGESNYKLTNLRRGEPSNVGPEVIRMKMKKNQE